MGVNGLLRLLQPVSMPRQLGHFQGQTLGVDGYAWLHRAAASCAEDLVKNTDTVKLVQSIDKRIRLYESAGVNLYFVFDGANIDMKARVCAQRQKARQQAKAAYLAHQTQSVMGGVSITPEHAAMVVAYLKARGIRFVVAPYEADSQLVYLEKHGFIDGILSEDSDLLVFGATRLLTKADGRTGDCIEVNAGHLPEHLTPSGMRALAIISGCDYSQGVAGLGPIKTGALVKNYGGDLMAICTSLLRSGRIDAQFIDEAQRADLAFQFQRVWDPRACKVVHLNDYLDIVDVALLHDSVIGPQLPRPDAHRIARCVVDPNDPKRMLPISPAVARFVARLPPIATATPSKYSSPTAVRSMVERRLPQARHDNVQTSPFFQKKPAIKTTPVASNSYDNKENVCALPTPPASIKASTSTATASAKRSSCDDLHSSTRMKAFRTDTVIDAVPTPVRVRNSAIAPQTPPLPVKITTAPERDEPPTPIRAESPRLNYPKTVPTVATPSPTASGSESGDKECSVMEKLASLSRFAYTRS